MDNDHSDSTNSQSDAGPPARIADQRTGIGAQTGVALSKVSEAAQQAGSQVKETATSLATKAGETAKGFVGQQVASGADFLGYIGRSAKVAAETLHPDAPQLAGFVRGMATSVTELSDTMRGQSPETMLKTASDYVRQNPALVLSAAAICGFALTRLLQRDAWNGSRSDIGPGSSATQSRSNAI